MKEKGSTKMIEGISLFLSGIEEEMSLPEGSLLQDKNLVATPHRVTSMFLELLNGYSEDPGSLLDTTWEGPTESDSLVIISDIDLVSVCAHHLAIFRGVVHVGYIPSRGRIVGLSKIVRVVEAFAHRLQLQEVLTEQIASTIDTVLTPQGVIVVISASHDCMRVRGVHSRNSITITSAVRGLFLSDPGVKAEFFSLLNKGGNQ